MPPGTEASRPGAQALERRHFQLRGVVQGVGFRPHVGRVAARHGVSGVCGNDDQRVFIEAQATAAVLDEFWADLLVNLPPLARVVSTDVAQLTVQPGETSFVIVASRRLAGVRTLIPADVATCDDCLAEMADPDDRRFAYPFTNCTNCGPRLTIITDLPYDRPQTTMSQFPMCRACEREYLDPDDRRFHAQPISCPDCGPRLWLVDAGSGILPEPDDRAPDWVPGDRTSQREVVEATTARLRAGHVVAVKGLGGFHLMCDARNPQAVATLRRRKHRAGKPFAVMVADEQAACRLARLAREHRELLTSPARPIVIAPMSDDYDLCEQVAPGLGDVGVMLAYTPLHALLLADPALALVATSGNLSEEPLCYTNPDAQARLSQLADALLLHDRSIHVPVEDSVHLAGDQGSQPVRRSRGYAPLPVVLPDDGPPTLAVGGELKNTFTLAVGDLAHVSAHIGDMDSLASQQAFDASVAQLVAMRRAQPQIVVADLHPGYATTGWAHRYVAAHPDVALVQVQHHLAHALSLVAEQGLNTGSVVVGALDGTGYGPDTTIWGGEILRIDLPDEGASDQPVYWSRVDHVPTFGLVGGDRAIRDPWRVALGLGAVWQLDLGHTPAWRQAPEAERRLVASQLASGFGVIPTSSAGRLFDAASAMLGVCLHTSYEAEAAMRLERAATSWQTTPLDRTKGPDSFRQVFTELLAQPTMPVAQRAWRFHWQLAMRFADVLTRAAQQAGTEVIGLTGGVLANRLFSGMLIEELARLDLTVLTHQVVPPNDGGLSLGQAWAGRLVTAGRLIESPVGQGVG